VELSEEQRHGLNVALNEATWLGIDVDQTGDRAAVFVEALTLPAEGPAPQDTAAALVLTGVSRIAASLRHGWWNDADAEIEQVALADLDTVVRSFGGCPIYGWEFIDPPEESWASWRDRLSLDTALSSEPAPHVLDLFQEGGSGNRRHLDLRVWFRDLHIMRRTGEHIALQEFIDGGLRWWDGLHAGDPRTDGKGIVPAG
jgi:hypothetical protein